MLYVGLGVRHHLYIDASTVASPECSLDFDSDPAGVQDPCSGFTHLYGWLVA